MNVSFIILAVIGIITSVSGLCDNNRVIVGGRPFDVPIDIIKVYPESGGIWECKPDKEPVNIPGNSDIFHLVLELMHYGNIVLPLTGKIDISHLQGNPDIFPLVLELMRWGNIVSPMTISTLSIKRELDVFGIPYSEDDIIDGDKVIDALKKENLLETSALRLQIKALLEAKNLCMKEKDELKGRLDEIGRMASGNPDFNSWEFAKGITVGVAGLGFLYLLTTE